VVDATGTVKYSFSYDEFGNTTATNRTGGGDPAYLPTLCQLLTYVGAYGVRNETAATGMFLMGQRWYDSTIGRFISQDPIGFQGGLNLYSYAAGNPISRIDPSGLYTIIIQGMRIDGSLNPFGHVAIALSGEGVYSFGNSTALGLDLTTYLQQQTANRGQLLTVINTTPAQEAEILKYLKSYKGNASHTPYSTCANRVGNSLSAGGMRPVSSPYAGLTGSSAFPDLTSQDAAFYSSLSFGSDGPVQLLIPKGDPQNYLGGNSNFIGQFNTNADSVAALNSLANGIYNGLRSLFK